MAEGLPRRHDLVWLDQSATGRIEACPADRSALADWLAQSRPFVVGRRDAGDRNLRLGFTLPGTARRQRIGIRAPLDAVVDRRPPPLLADLAKAAPDDWQQPLRALSAHLQRIGVTARCYGSLVNQAICGESCLRPDSDIDLIVDSADADEAIRALAILAAHGNGVPRIDGELRLYRWSVAWRELAAAVGTTRKVLAKSDTAVELRPADSILHGAHTREDGNDYALLPEQLAA